MTEDHGLYLPELPKAAIDPPPPSPPMSTEMMTPSEHRFVGEVDPQARSVAPFSTLMLIGDPTLYQSTYPTQEIEAQRQLPPRRPPRSERPAE